MSGYNPTSRFRINLVPSKTKLEINQKGGFTFFQFSLDQDKFDFKFLKNAMELVPNIHKDIELENYLEPDEECYYVLETTNGKIRFEINNGRKNWEKIVKERPSTISIETDPCVPTSDFLVEIKEVVKLLIKKTGFKIFFWDAARFVTIDELYGREGPTTK